MSKLPYELGYLEPVIAELEALDPDDIDESFDTATLLRGLRDRVRGLPARAAAKRLEADRRLLLEWLSSHQEHPAHFIAAFMDVDGLGESSQSVKTTEPARPPKSRAGPGFRVSVIAPTGFTQVEQRGSLVLLSPSGGFVISPTTADAQQSSSGQVLSLSGGAAESVTYGLWHGTRAKFAGREFIWLESSGRHVDVVVDCGGEELDSSTVAAVLSQLICA